MSKGDITFALICAEPVINEKKYIIDSNNEIIDSNNKMNNVRLHLFTVSPYISKKKKHQKIRKRLYDIQKITKADRSLKNKLLKELNIISIDLNFE